MKITDFTVLDEEIEANQISTNSLVLKKSLNPLIWNNELLHEEVLDQALAIADDYFEFITKDIGTNVNIHDIYFTGSLANYNWSKYSDFDIHIAVDYAKLNDNVELISSYFRDRTTLYSLKNKYNIEGFEVELNMNDIVKFRENAGVYSLLKNKWIQKPNINEISIDYDSVKTKTASMMNAIDHTECKLADLKNIKDKIRKMRDSALEKDGEFATENLVFKLLRRSGYIEKLKNNIDSLSKLQSSH